MRRTPGNEAVLRLNLADLDSASAGGTLLFGMGPRWAAAAWDVCVLLAIGLLFFAAFNRFWMPLAIATLVYYAAGILLLGNTPGVSLFAPAPAALRAGQPAQARVVAVQGVRRGLPAGRRTAGRGREPVSLTRSLRASFTDLIRLRSRVLATSGLARELNNSGRGSSIFIEPGRRQYGEQVLRGGSGCSRRRIGGVRDEDIRQDQRQGRQRQGRLDGAVHRGDAGADAKERRRRSATSIRKTQAAQSSADSARQAASDAGAEANAARARASEVGSKADEFDTAYKRLVYTVVLSEDEGQFGPGKIALPEDAKAKLDELVTKLKADPNGAFFEIEGHTDALGTKTMNEKIGLDRAEAVKRYLFEQHQIPLHRINVISYGMDKPVASNKTREGRAQNRRVVIRVLV